jgi:hypothetical protein
MILAAAALQGWTEEPALEDAAESVLDLETGQKIVVGDERKPVYSKWFMHYGMANAYPKIESEQLVRDFFDPLMEFLSPAHDEVLLISELRDMGLVWAPQLGVGRMLGEYFAFTALGSYAGGKVRTEQTNRSILLLPLHSDFSITRSAAVIDLALDWYPLKAPVRRDFDSWKERFRASKPRVGVNSTFVWATYDAKVQIQFVPLPNLTIKLDDKWFIPSFQFRLGYDIPIDRRNLLQFNLGYQWFTAEQHDFNGPVFSISWKSFFRARNQTPPDQD